MFLDKFRNRYSFNFLSACGWIVFALFTIFTCPELYIEYIVGNTAHAWGVGITFLGILIVNILFYLITFFVYVFELISLKRITNEKFLNNKYIKICQTLGIIFAFLPIMMVVFFLIVGFIQNIIYDIRSID